MHRDFLAGSNATGSFTFTGLFTEDAAQDPNTGSSVCGFSAGLAAVRRRSNSSLSKSYLRDNVYRRICAGRLARLPQPDAAIYGVRYEFFAPYTEKYGHLADGR